jgi:cob(I)alamin adenosyltransferase
MPEDNTISHLKTPEPFAKGIVQVYTGEGKGKTSAALGLVLRAAGHGLRCHLVYFLKGNTRFSEEKSLTLLPGVSFARFGIPGFVNPHRVKQAEKEEAQQGLAEAERALTSGNFNLIILDEINVALDLGLITLEQVLHLMSIRPESVELVLTGRGAAPEVIAKADLVSELVEVKHPFNSGLLARQGIDY